MRRSEEKTEAAKIRVSSGLLQKEAAARLGVSERHLRAVELGQRNSKSLLAKLRSIR